MVSFIVESGTMKLRHLCSPHGSKTQHDRSILGVYRKHNMMLLAFLAVPAVLKGVVPGRVKGRGVCRKHNMNDRDVLSVVNKT